MRPRKSNEPRALKKWRRENPSETDFDALAAEVKQAVRDRLRADQHELCCYCYGALDRERWRVEHIEPRSDTNVFSWDNLALACDGSQGRRRQDTHCDFHKGDTKLRTVHPYRAPVMDVARLRSSGKLSVPDDQPDGRADVLDTLNLNSRILVGARKGALEGWLAESPKKRWSVRRLESALAELRRRAGTHSFGPLIEQWLERQMRQR